MRRRRAALSVAVEDLEDAIDAHPEIAEVASTKAIFELIRLELAALGPPGTPPSDGPGAAV